MSHPKSGENVRVVIRCRPPNSSERERNEPLIVTMDQRNGSVRVQRPDAENEFKTFTFDNVYAPDTKQISIFNDIAKPIIDSVLNGYNGTLFCYGQTGTGKTFTMEGVVDDDNLRGLMPNSFFYVFEGVSSFGSNQEFLVRASFLEIYKDEVYDLLNTKTRAKMDVKESPDKGVFVKDLSTFPVKSADDLLRVLKTGQKQRKVGATKMNEGSSRSHSILTITVESSTKGEKGDVHYKSGKLNLVDLAGSERQRKTEASGERLDEAKSINWSLTVLGNCIKALVEPNSKFVPYRDSKLTRLLQDSLGGNTKTVMCANLGPCGENYDETLSTLRYADRAKQIKNRPVINEDPKDTMLRQMQEEISRLKLILEARKNGGSIPPELLEKMKNGTVSSAEGEHIMQMTQLLADGTVVEEVEEKVIEKIVEKDTGIREEDVQKMKEEVEKEFQRVQQEKLRENIQAEEAKTMAEAAAQRLEEELRLKMKQLDSESSALTEMQRKIEQKEKQLLSGQSQIEIAEKSKLELKRTEEELQLRRANADKLKQELENAEEQELFMVENYKNAQDELNKKTSKLKKLWSKYQERKNELNELQEEFALERNDLLETIRLLDKSLKYKNLILNSFIPGQFLDLIESQAIYEQAQDVWIIPGIELSGNNMARGAGGDAAVSVTANMAYPVQVQQQQKRDRRFKRTSQGANQASNLFETNSMGNNGGPTSPRHARFFNYQQFMASKGGGKK